MIGYQFVYTLLVTFNQAFFQHSFDFLNLIEVMPLDVRVRNHPCRPQALQGSATDFQESTYFVTVHPNFIFIGLVFVQMIENVIGNSCLLYASDAADD